MKLKQKNTWTKQKGITLIALVVTIVVLLILAGVSLNLVIGNTGVLKYASSAKEETVNSQVYERLVLEAHDYIIESNAGTTIYGTFVEYLQGKGILDSNNVVNVEQLLGSKQSFGNGTLETGDVYVLEQRQYVADTDSEGIALDYYLVYYNSEQADVVVGKVINASDATSGTVLELISTEESYVGYYADIDGDGTPDGIIYADLLCGPFNGAWGSYTYSISEDDQITSSKDYYIVSESYSGNFGTKAVIAPTGSGDERFYIMALDDISTTIEGYGYSTFTWYACIPSEDAAAGYVYYGAYLPKDTSIDFGTGKDNTATMMTQWENEYYGPQSTHDLWGVIDEEVGEGWFLPSYSEWIAFLSSSGVTVDNYNSSFGLRGKYWSSSEAQQSATTWYCGHAWFAVLNDNNGYVNSGSYGTGNYYCVRLSTTF